MDGFGSHPPSQSRRGIRGSTVGVGLSALGLGGTVAGALLAVLSPWASAGPPILAIGLLLLGVAAVGAARAL